MSIPNPNFHCDELEQAVSAARPIIENVDELRNRVSADIKALGTRLNGLRYPFEYPLGKGFVVPECDGNYVAAALEDCGCTSGEVHEESLAWETDATGRFRFVYALSKWDGSIEVDMPGGPLFWDESTMTRDAKPLIETKWEIRKRLFRKLPDFVRALGKHFAVEPVPELDPDGLPF